jgi:hypothetical protein
VPTGLGLGIELDDDGLRFFERDASRRRVTASPVQAGR